MQIGIRAQILFPLVPLVLGMSATTAWTAYSAAAAARSQIFADLGHIADTVQQATFPRNLQTLRLMKGLSSADLLLCDKHDRPILDDEGNPLTTLPTVPETLPHDFDNGTPTPIRVAGTEYLCRGVRLTHDRLYLFLPATILEEAVARAVRPAIAIGSVGGAAAVLLALGFTQGLTGRIQDLQRRTRLIAAGDFSPMPLQPRGDELADLGRSINDMAQQLARFQESQKATERLRLLGQVSGGLAHQLRNGIAGAKLALQLYERELQAGPDADSSDGRAEPSQRPDDALAVALRQLTLMESYLRRFLDLGKAIEPRRQSTDLAGLARETADLLRPQCTHANIELRLDVADRLAPMSVDAGQIRQVLFNLISNAIEAAGPGGDVEVRLTAAGAGAMFEVCDSGPGIADSVQPRLFEPFNTGKPEGIGLGLAVSRQIVEAHGGKLTWSRTAGRTCFRMDLSQEPT